MGQEKGENSARSYVNSITLVGFVGSDPEQRQAKGNGSDDPARQHSFRFRMAYIVVYVRNQKVRVAGQHVTYFFALLRDASKS